MFTGLIEAVGSIETIEEHGDARRFSIATPDDAFLHDAQLGDSIAVSGACLTVVELSPRAFAVQAVEETLRRTVLGAKNVGARVNLERALKLGARLGGHIVQGHVDGVGAIARVRDEGNSFWVTLEPPSGLMRYIVEKGSICIDGISLTVANVAYSTFSVAVIPHTWDVTTANDWTLGTHVNLEVDLIAKYVERLTQFTASANQPQITRMES